MRDYRYDHFAVHAQLFYQMVSSQDDCLRDLLRDNCLGCRSLASAREGVEAFMRICNVEGPVEDFLKEHPMGFGTCNGLEGHQWVSRTLWKIVLERLDPEKKNLSSLTLRALLRL